MGPKEEIFFLAGSINFENLSSVLLVFKKKEVKGLTGWFLKCCLQKRSTTSRSTRMSRSHQTNSRGTMGHFTWETHGHVWPRSASKCTTSRTSFSSNGTPHPFALSLSSCVLGGYCDKSKYVKVSMKKRVILSNRSLRIWRVMWSQKNHLELHFLLKS